MPRESFETTACPMCGESPGLFEQPYDGWPHSDGGEGSYPPEWMISVPCPLCYGEGKIPREEWDRLSGAKRKPVEKKKEKKAEPEKKTGMWDAMKETKRKQEEDWMSQPNFKFKKD